MARVRHPRGNAHSRFGRRAPRHDVGLLEHHYPASDFGSSQRSQCNWLPTFSLVHRPDLRLSESMVVLDGRAARAETSAPIRTGTERGGGADKTPD